MNFIDRLDPELRESFAMLQTMAPEEWAELDAPARRRLTPSLTVNPDDVDGDVQWNEVAVPAPSGHAVRIRIYRPTDDSAVRPGALMIHGGGMWTGTIDSEHLVCLDLVNTTGIIALSVEYRLAPENPYPAGLDDVFLAYTWVISAAAELGLDPLRLAIIGGSAGGGLAVSAALRIRDAGIQQPRLLMAMYPMIDDRNEKQSSYQDIPFPAWNRRDNVEAWEWYLAGKAADGYAAPARQVDLRGLPPAFFDVGTCDLFFDEVIDFAERVQAAGVPTELHVYPGLFHAAEHLAPDTALSRRVRSNRIEAIRQALAADTGLDAAASQSLQSHMSASDLDHPRHANEKAVV